MASESWLMNESTAQLPNDTLNNGTDVIETPWEWIHTIPSYVVTGLFVWAAIFVTSHQVRL